MTDSTALATKTPMDELDPRQRLAVELYTNPLFGKTFGRKQASCVAAGYEGGNAYMALNRESTQRAIQWVQDQRDENGEAVAQHLSRYAIDAAHKLVKQLGMDEGLEIHPMPEGILDKKPEPIMGLDKDGNEILLGYDDSHLKQAKAIADHNKATANVAREVRQAIQLVLAYHMGTPEQKVRVAREKEAQDPLDLGKMTAAELRELAQAVRQTTAMRDGAPPPAKEDGAVVEADFEVVDEATPQPAEQSPPPGTETHESSPPAPVEDTPEQEVRPTPAEERRSRPAEERGLPF